MLTGTLRTVFEVTFDHETLDETFNVVVLVAAVDNVLCDADLLEVFLAGVVVVSVYSIQSFIFITVPSIIF